MTNTFKAPGTKTWAKIVDGADYGRFGLQVVADQTVKVCISTADPAPDTEDYMELSPSRTREVTESLTTSDKVYIKTDPPVAIAVRGLRGSR